MPSTRSRRRDEDDDLNDRPRRPRRRRTPNTVIVVTIILAVALPLLLGVAGFLIYRLSTSSTEPEVKSGAATASPSRMPAPAVDDRLQTYRKKLIGTWETDRTSDGITRHIFIEFKPDGRQVAWGFTDGRRSEAGGLWEAVKVENGQLLVRTVVNGITRETFYSFPSDNEFRYTMPNGQEVVARRAK